MRVALDMEEAYLNGTYPCGVAIELSKAFGNAPIGITLELLGRLGIHHRIPPP